MNWGLALLGAWLILASFKRKMMNWPIANGYGRITSPFGERRHPRTGVKDFHNGIDIAAPEGTPVVAPASGFVSRVWYDKSGGLQIIIRHDNGYRTGYAHLDNVEVRTGQRVRPGQVIGYVGQTGMITGPHLHFTVTDPRGKKVDPLRVIQRPA